MHPERKSHHPADPHNVEHLLREAGWVRTLAARLAHDHAAAEDAAQATLTLALERAPTPATSLRPWLAHVLRRLTRRERRGSARRALREAHAARERDTTTPSSDTQLARLEEQERLAHAVRALSEPYRGVILAHFYEGLDAASIAARNSTSPATVRSQLARGLTQLRERLTREHGGDRGRTLALFVLAAGRESAATPPLLQLLAMQTTTKLAIGATFIVVTALATGTWLRWSSTPLQPERGGAMPLSADLEAVASAPLVDAGMRNGIASAARAAATSLSSESSTSGPTHAVPPAAPRTVVRVRAVGERDTPLPDATLTSVHGNGRPRRSAPSSPSGPDGEVRLSLVDSELSLLRVTVFPMVFALQAPGRATRFVVSTPALHAETDLGPIALAPGGSVRGRVVDIAGHPIAGAQVLASGQTLAGSQGDLERGIRGPDLDIPRPFTTTGAAGTFWLAGLDVGHTRLWVHAPRHLWHFARVMNVASGTAIDVGDLVLDPVPAARAIGGTVVLPDGAPAADVHVALGDGRSGYEARTATDVAGHFLAVPEQHGAQPSAPVTLVAVDPARRYGPSAETVVAIGVTDVRLELRPLRTLEVTVTNAAGEPLEDAFIDVSVLARSAEHATGEVVVTLAPGRDVDGIVIELTASGVIEGTLLPPPGVDPRTLVVAASRGDGFPVWTRPDAEGRYRLERLTPGPWRVEGRNREPARETLGAANHPDEKEFRWNVDVREGATARCDVDMRDRGIVALHGRFLIDGTPASGWRVTLQTRGHEFGRAELPSATLDDTGRFVLTAPAGRYDVRLSGSIGAGAARADVRALRELDLRGPRLDWEATITTGALRGSVAPGTARLRLVRHLSLGRDRETTEFVPAPDGTYDLRVPVGKSRLQHETEGPNGLGWLTLDEIEPR